MVNPFDRKNILKKKFKLNNLEDRGEKFIIVQIDGLGYKLIKQLSKTKYLPFVRKLLKKYYITSYNPGYPTTTPFVQAGILYGDNSMIPGFRFCDKKTKQPFNMGVAQHARKIESELTKKNKGILKGGTSISTIFSGDANRAILTIGNLYKTESGTKKVTDVLLLLFLNPVSVVRVSWDSFKELMIEFYESFTEIISKTFRNKPFNWPFFWPYFPFFRMLVNSTIKEIGTQSALLEMDRHSPYIYINYGGYDWIAHYRGPRTLSGFHLLKQIDKSVKKLYKKAMKEGYDFYLMSDHGQIEAIPFDRLYYESFAEFVQKATDTKAKSFDLHEVERGSRTKFLKYKLKYYYKGFSLPLKAFASLFLNALNISSIRFRKKSPKLNWQAREQIMMLYSSSLCQMYFNHTTKRLNLGEIGKRYPSLLENLTNHPGVGFVLGKEKDSIKVLSKNGTVVITKDSVKKTGEDFLSHYGDEKKIVEQVRTFANLKYSGDLIINGHYDGKRIVSFEDFHFGSHDSFGGDQTDAFFISKNYFDFSKVRNAKELYEIFKRYHS